ncbi:MAG: biopolymer transporter ExbD [Verrucomicrobiales bacterium]|jgi:biopolymer transport protein ExbD|nr:biopolymer transporter ExbD [Verrucomicrobiales bacterium]
MRLRRSIKPLGGALDLTPLVNVVLLLLVFFLLGSTFVIQPGIRVNPPVAFTSSGMRDIRYVINVTAQNPPLIFFNNQLVTLEDLQAELKQLAARQPNTVVALRADQQVPYGAVVDIMTRAINAGVHILNATQPPAP